MTVLRRWAITIRVVLSLLILSVTISCVLLSKELVASSKKRIRGFFTIARAISILWHCPPDKVPPVGLTIVNNPMGISSISSSKPTIRTASWASFIVRLEAPIIFFNISPGTNLLFCNTTPICWRTSLISRVDKSFPS